MVLGARTWDLHCGRGAERREKMSAGENQSGWRGDPWLAGRELPVAAAAVVAAEEIGKGRDCSVP